LTLIILSGDFKGLLLGGDFTLRIPLDDEFLLLIYFFVFDFYEFLFKDIDLFLLFLLFSKDLFASFS